MGTERAAERAADAAGQWLATLDPAQRARATFPFDTDERFVWDYRPGERRGLPLGDMTEAQRTAAMAIVDAGSSERGAREVRSIIALEPILGELERQAGRGNWMRRDPGLYWFAVFGEPGSGAPWAWRVGGHHVAIQATLAGGAVLGTAPSFLGANPATVPSGAHAGSRAIEGEERLARALLASLSPAQRRMAVVDPVAPPDILSGNGRRADLRDVPDRHPRRPARGSPARRAGGIDPPLPRAGDARRGGRRVATASRTPASIRSRSPGPVRTRRVRATTTPSAGRAC